MKGKRGMGCAPSLFFQWIQVCILFFSYVVFKLQNGYLSFLLFFLLFNRSFSKKKYHSKNNCQTAKMLTAILEFKDYIFHYSTELKFKE